MRAAPRSRRRPLAVAAAAALLAGACAPAPEPGPDVLVISIDTLRRDFLGTAGDPHGTSPWLDRLARQGLSCAAAWSTSSWTLPSHMSLFTGQYPASHGVWADGRSLPAGKRTLAEMLSDRGYRTGGFWSGPYLHPAYGFARGFEVYEECVNYRIRVNESGAVANTADANLRSRSGVTAPGLHEKAMAWLDGIGPGEPYLLFLHYWDPHADYEPPAPYDRFLGGEYRGRITGHGVLQDPRIRPDMPEADLKRLLDLYRGEIRWTDEWIGKVVRRLEERGGLDRTMMVVTADHGEEFFEHGVRGHRHNLYGPSVRIPMILRLPARFPAGAVRDAPASLVDVLPTVAAAVGAPAPRRTHGVDLARPPDGPRAVFASLEDRLEAARDGKWKVIRSRDGTVEQLFRVDRDPGERADRRAEDPEAWARLLGALRRPERGQWAPDSLPFPELDPDTEAELRALGYAD